MAETRPTVFLLWDNVSAEHGEEAELVTVFATRESAETVRKGYSEDERDFLVIEEREVVL